MKILDKINNFLNESNKFKKETYKVDSKAKTELNNYITNRTNRTGESISIKKLYNTGAWNRAILSVNGKDERLFFDESHIRPNKWKKS